MGPQDWFKAQHRNVLRKCFKNCLHKNNNIPICDITMHASSDSAESDQLVIPGYIPGRLKGFQRVALIYI